MKMKKRITRAFGVLLALSLFTAMIGCAEDTGSSSESSGGTQNSSAAEENTEKVTIRILDQNTKNTDGMTAFVESIEAYAEEVSDRYIIEHEGIAGDDIKTAMKTYVAAGNTPDIVEYWNSASDSGSMMDAGVFLPIDEFFEASEELSEEDFLESHYYYHNGVSYGIPMDHALGVWLVNKNIFEEYNLEYPKTYDDIIEIGKVLSANGVITLAMGSKGGNPLHFPLSDLYGRMEGAEEEMNSISQTGIINTDLFVEALTIIDEMRQAGCFPSDTITNGDWGPTLALYNEGRAAMYYLLSGNANAVTEEAYAWSEIIDHPQLTGELARDDQDDMGIMLGNKAMFICKEEWDKSDAKKEAIVDYLEFYFSDDMCQFYYDAKATQSAKIMEYKDDNAVPLAIDMKQYYEDRPNITKTAQIHMLTIPNDTVWAEYQSYLDEFLAGALTPEEYADKVQDSMDRNYKVP